MDANPSPAAPTRRLVRVFLSSTFRDMHADREELVKRVFPHLRKLCESRGVAWAEVDLRWGVTDEAKAEGKVLPTCLAEIDNCRPYFIGLLGERYGWVPPADAIAPELRAREPWLDQAAGRSVTELEILHGALNRSAPAAQAIFYFRDPAYLERLPAGTDPADFRPESRAAAEQLAALKARIRAAGLRVRAPYRDPQELGAWVRADLTEWIERAFPAGSTPDPLDREAAEHEAYAEARRGVYVAHPADFARLDAHADGTDRPLAVVGASGLGKSALLANWAAQYRVAHPDALVVTHFIGSTPQSTDWAGMVRRLLGELARRFGLARETPADGAALRTAFAHALHRAAARGRTVLVLDGLDQLEDRDGAPDLAWLPPELPAPARLVVSTLPGRALDEATRRGWPTLVVQPLGVDERQELIRTHLAAYRKALDAPRVRRIAEAAPAANPLFLRALLEELRVFGTHERLDERIDRYLRAVTPAALFEAILERYEADYEGERPGLVRDALSHLWAARRGLAEPELLDLLGAAGAFPRAAWSTLFLAAEASLVSRSGFIGFFHGYLRAAVAARYLPDAASQRAAHRRLAEYFAAAEPGPRRTAELPWQLAEAGDWPALAALLADLRFFGPAWAADRADVKARWARVEAASELRRLDAYAPVLAAPDPATQPLDAVAELLGDAGHHAEAVRLWAAWTEGRHAAGDTPGEMRGVTRQVEHLTKLGAHAEAINLLLQRERARLATDVDKAGALFDQFSEWDQQERGGFAAQIALMRELEQVARAAGDPSAARWARAKEALQCEANGDLAGALARRREEEADCRARGDLDALVQALDRQADLHLRREEPEAALARIGEEERVLRGLGDVAGLARALCGRAWIHERRGEVPAALAAAAEAERICRELGDPGGLAGALEARAAAVACGGDADSALALLREQEAICRRLDEPAGLRSCLGRQARLARDRGDLDGALTLLRAEEELCGRLQARRALVACWEEQAKLRIAHGEVEEVMPLLDDLQRLCRKVDDLPTLLRCLGYQAALMVRLGATAGACGIYEERTRLCRIGKDGRGVCENLCESAILLAQEMPVLAVDAFDRLKEADETAAADGNAAGRALARAATAAVLSVVPDRTAEALPAAAEACRLAAVAGDPATLRRVEEIQAAIKKRLEPADDLPAGWDSLDVDPG